MCNITKKMYDCSLADLNVEDINPIIHVMFKY